MDQTPLDGVQPIPVNSIFKVLITFNDVCMCVCVCLYIYIYIYSSIDGELEAFVELGMAIFQTFMSIAAHERCLTNNRRSRWGSGISP